MTSNYPPDHNPDLDMGEDPTEEVSDFDTSDELEIDLVLSDDDELPLYDEM